MGNMNLAFLVCLFSAGLLIYSMGNDGDRISICLTPASSFAAFVMGGILEVIGFQHLIPIMKLTGGAAV